MQKDFDGKTVIVTGSSSGIGEAIAILFAKRGANVTLHGRNQERLQAVLKKCQEAAGESGDTKTKFIAVRGDIRDKETREKLVDDTISHFGQLDVLVCNHGINIEVYDISEETEETYNKVMDTNLKSVYFLIQKAVPYLGKTQGNILNTSSIASTDAYPVLIPYNMSKAAMDHMTRCLALQLAPKGIRVNSINPTAVPTRITEAFKVNFTQLPRIAAAHPLHNRASTPEEQAEVAVFLSSGAASFISGECLKVDGARSLGRASLATKE